MTYADQWRALSSRIRGLMQAGQLRLAARPGDSYGSWKFLREQIKSTLLAAQSFRDDYEPVAPSACAGRC